MTKTKITSEEYWVIAFALFACIIIVASGAEIRHLATVSEDNAAKVRQLQSEAVSNGFAKWIPSKVKSEDCKFTWKNKNGEFVNE